MTWFPRTTERLVLRPVEAHDAAELHERIDSDPDVKRFTGGVLARDEVEAAVARTSQRMASSPYGLFVARDRSDGDLVGYGLLAPLRWEGPDIEVGYGVTRSRWRRGYASEICDAMLGYAFDGLGLATVVAVVDHANPVSRRVASTAGFRYEREIPWPGDATSVELLRLAASQSRRRPTPFRVSACQ